MIGEKAAPKKLLILRSANDVAESGITTLREKPECATFAQFAETVDAG